MKIIFFNSTQFYELEFQSHHEWDCDSDSHHYTKLNSYSSLRNDELEICTKRFTYFLHIYRNSAFLIISREIQEIYFF
jgi:hypothetical protein